MAVRAVMRAWQMDRLQRETVRQADDPRPVHRKAAAGTAGWSRPLPGSSDEAVADVIHDDLAVDERWDAEDRYPVDDRDDDDPAIRIEKRDHIVPRRPVVASASLQNDSFWTSHLFWKGILVGALCVLLVKTAITVQAPFGIDWYG